MIAYQRGSDRKEFNSYGKFGKARFYGFPGANLKQLSSYIDVNLENSNSDTLLIHVAIYDLLNGNNEPQIDSIIQNIGMIIEKCQSYGIKSIFISGLLYTTRVKLSILEETHKKFEVFCCNNGVILIDSRNIRGRHLYRDGLHLLVIENNIDILIVTETKIDFDFSSSQFMIEGFSLPFRFDRNRSGGGVIVYVWDDIPS